MALETPNQIHASAEVLLELEALGTVAATMESSTGFSALEYVDADEVLALTLVSQLSRFEGMVVAGLTGLLVNQALIGPPLDPLGIAALDALQDDQVGLQISPEFEPPDPGAQLRLWVQVYKLPLLGV